MVFLGFALIGLGAGRRERRAPAPAVRRPLPRLRGRVRRLVRHARQSAGQQHRPLLHGLRPAAAPAAASHAAAAAVPLRRARDHPHRAVRPPAVRHRDQPLSQRGGAAADHARATSRPRWRPLATSTTPTTASTWSRCAATGRRSTSRRPATPSRAAGTARRTRSTTASSTRPTTRPSTSPGCRAWACSTSSRRSTGRSTRGAGERRRLLESSPAFALRRADRRLAHLPAAGRASRCSSRSRSRRGRRGDVLSRRPPAHRLHA